MQGTAVRSTEHSPPPFEASRRGQVSSRLESLFRCWAWACALSGAFSACSVNLKVPSNNHVDCDNSDQCPASTVCATGIKQCVNAALLTNEGPRLQSATATSANSVALVFSVPVVVEDDAATTSTIPSSGANAGLSLQAMTRDPLDDSRVLLTTSAQKGQQPYTLTVNGVTDIFGNAIAPDGRTIAFNGFGAAPDGAPPSFIFPAEGQQFALGEVNVVWSGLALVESYSLEVWTTDPALGGSASATYTTTAPTTTTAITLDTPTTHWLRLRSDATRAGEFATRRLEAIGDTLYVYCPAGQTCSDATTGGNLANPRRSVARAIEDSRSLGASRVLVAARGNDEVYAETFDVYSHLTIRGGYDATFSEGARSPSGNRTIVKTTDATVVRCTSVKAATEGALVVEGLELVSQSSDPSSVVSFVNCDDGILIRDNVIRNEGTNVSRTGVFMQSSRPEGAPGPKLENNQISSGLGVQVVGVNTKIRNNVFVTGGIPEAGGVFVTGGVVDIDDNSIVVDAGGVAPTGGWVAVYVLQLNPFTGTVNVRNNVINVGDGPRASDGVIFENADGEISGNTITTGSAPFVAGILVESTERISRVRRWQVTDNVISVGHGKGSAATSAAIFVGDRGDPAIATFARNRATVGGLLDGGTAAGVIVGSEAVSTFPSELTFYNNVFDVGAAANGTGAGNYTYLIGARPKLTWVHNTFRWESTTPAVGTPKAGGVIVVGSGITNIGMTLVNNLFVGPSTVTGGVGVYSDETAPVCVMNNNLAVGVSRFAKLPGRSAGAVDDAFGVQSNLLFGASNLGPTGAVSTEADLQLIGVDGPLEPTGTSPAVLRVGGANSLLSFCGETNDQSCGGVGDDFLLRSRTCVGSNCTSIGAYEVD